MGLSARPSLTGTFILPTKTKSGNLQNMKVTDAMAYVLFAYLVIGSTWGYTSNDAWYLIGTGLGTILGLSSVISKEYSHKELVVVATAFIVSVFVAIVARSLTLLLTTVVIASSKGMRVTSLLKFFLTIKVVSFSILIAFGMLGIFETVEVFHYSALAGETIGRLSINGVATNILHLGLFAIMVLIIALKQDKLSLLAYIVMMAVNIAFYYSISYSSGGLIATSCALILAAAVRYSRWAKKAVCRYAFLVVPITVVFFLYTGYQYNGTGMIEELNRLTTGRIAYNHYWLSTFGPSLFGINSAGRPAAFDNSVVYLVVGQGVVVAAAILGGYWAATKRLGKSGEAYLLLLVLSFYLFSMSESILPSIVVNPSLIVVLDVLLPGFYLSVGSVQDQNLVSSKTEISKETRVS